MRERIDWDYIARAEGGRRTRIYVVENAANAGPTIATGFDLGARRVGDLRALGLGPDLVRKLAPYVGKKGAEAARVIAENPLEISDQEASHIDRLAKKKIVTRFVRTYDQAAKKNPAAAGFRDLPGGLQTAIMSVVWQYGPDLARRTPRFWRCITDQDWPGAHLELMDFKDKYPTRRSNDAALVGQWLGRAAPAPETAAGRGVS